MSKMIGKTALLSGKWAHSFPFFGTEVRGAAVKAFTRVAEVPINIKSYIYEPDIIIVTNENLLEDPETVDGLKDEGCLLVNSKKDHFLDGSPFKVVTINATDMALKIIGKPIVNTMMFGAFIAISNLVPLKAAGEIISGEFSGKIAELNISALEAGYREIAE